jgi:hypothetical protein
MTPIDLTRRITLYESGRRKEEYFLFAPHLVEMLPGLRVHLGSRKNLLLLRNKIDKYLNENEQNRRNETNPL